jgi:glycosyltransferase involved in cell wall biosynthesis
MLPARVSNAIHYGLGFYGTKITDDYDVINAHASPSEWIRHRNKRVLWYCHTLPRELYDLKNTRVRTRSVAEELLYGVFSKGYEIEERRIVKKIEAIAANSDTTKERLSKYLSCNATVINPGVDYDRFSNSGDGKYFFYPSRIAQQKRQEYVIEAFERFVKMTGNDKHKLVIAGSVSSRYSDFSAYFEKLKAMRVKNVVFKQNPSDNELAKLYSNSTAVLFSAINEDFGIVPLEGMASSKPVISVNEGGPKETILDGKTGFLVNSPKEMAERMRFVVEHKSLADDMGKAGRSRIISDYSWKSFFKKFDPLARKVSRM